MTSFIWLLGGLGMVAVEGSYAPQLLRLYKMKRADEISYLFPGLNFCGRVLAMSYSLMVGNSVFGFGFMFGCLLRFALLCQVYWYRHGGRRPDSPDESARANANANADGGAMATLATSSLR